MLFHAISPSYGYVKASHDVIRHPRLGSDAKVLITYVQGLPPGRAERALSDHAKWIGITGRAYQKAKAQLKEDGFVHEWRRQGDGGLWVTDQLVSNVSLSDGEARRFRDARAESPQVGPSSHHPTVGHPGTRSAGGYLPVDEEREKNSTHPPSEVVRKATESVESEPEAEVGRQVARLRPRSGRGLRGVRTVALAGAGRGSPRAGRVRRCRLRRTAVRWCGGSTTDAVERGEWAQGPGRTEEDRWWTPWLTSGTELGRQGTRRGAVRN
ncbi:hypothetical protein FHX80_113312 [Streptomyces brevispora]|uniref:Uncharacterized protein n=1 Tax=Streptomyces brevispora TaxID=887462 RepID=A0A561UZN8_9ACTN|nr:hypothetical protein FHX80_113312 [Streptomyces brevispora]